MNSKKLRVLLIFLFLFSIFVIPNNALSNNINSQKNKLYKKNRLIRQKKNQVKNLKWKEFTTSVRLSKLQKKLESTKVRLNDIKYQHKLVSKELEKTNKDLIESEKKLKSQIKETLNRMKNMHRVKYFDYLMFLFNSKELSTFVKRAVYFKYINTKDSQIINVLNNKKQKILDLKKEVTKKKTKITNISNQMSQQQKTYLTQKSRTEYYLKNIKTKRAFYEREVKSLQNESNRIAYMLRKLIESQRRSRLKKFKGKIGWPAVATNITSYFGYRRHPIFRTKRLHSGIDIGGGRGSGILAAADGIVIHSGWRGGYGKCVIIDHGGGIATLYGHASRLYVRKGSRVKRGQKIAAIGSTGFSTGPHLHFEVRKNGSPVNPMSYLR